MRSFDDVVANLEAAEQGEPAPDPITPGEAQPAPAANPAGMVMDVRTGEVLNLGEASADQLAAFVDANIRLIADATGWKHQAEDELRKRLGKDKVRVFGDWEVAAVSGRGRKWDTQDLRDAVHDLIQAGVLKAGDVSDLILAGEPSVNGEAARRLLGQVPDEHRAALEACFTWERKGRASVKVTRSRGLTSP